MSAEGARPEPMGYAQPDEAAAIDRLLAMARMLQRGERNLPEIDQEFLNAVSRIEKALNLARHTDAQLETARKGLYALDAQLAERDARLGQIRRLAAQHSLKEVAALDEQRTAVRKAGAVDPLARGARKMIRTLVDIAVTADGG